MFENEGGEAAPEDTLTAAEQFEADGAEYDEHLDDQADDGDEFDEGEGDDELTQEELDEWEHSDGKRYKIPKALVPHLMKDADYTRKTQETAAEKRAIAAEREQIARMSEERIAAVAEVKTAERNIAKLEQQVTEHQRAGDFASLAESMALLDQWRRYGAKTVEKVQQIDHQVRHQAASETHARMERAVIELESAIPGWTNGIGQKVAKFAMERLGFDEEHLEQLSDPRFGKLLHRAWMQEAGSKIQGTRQPKQAEAPKPLTTVSKGRAPAAAGLSDSLSMAEWARRDALRTANRRRAGR